MLELYLRWLAICGNLGSVLLVGVCVYCIYSTVLIRYTESPVPENKSYYPRASRERGLTALLFWDNPGLLVTSGKTWERSS